MPLIPIELPVTPHALPIDVSELLDEADRRIDAFVKQRHSSEHGFVASDYVAVYLALQQIVERGLATGSTFCEWGSGFGVVALLAAKLGFDACGIEIDASLVGGSVELGHDLEIPAEFVQGSFIPPGGEELAETIYSENDSGVFWLATDADDAYQLLELDADDFDLIFAYPWPGEAGCVEGLFERYAADGALLLTYAHLESMRLLRKVPE